MTIHHFARKVQEERFKPFKGIHSNAQMSEKTTRELLSTTAD